MNQKAALECLNICIKKIPLYKCAYYQKGLNYNLS